MNDKITSRHKYTHAIELSVITSENISYLVE